MIQSTKPFGTPDWAPSYYLRAQRPYDEAMNKMMSNAPGDHQNQFGYQIPIFRPLCLHENCPICVELKAKQLKHEHELAVEAANKRLAYTNRCAEYMKKYRERFPHKVKEPQLSDRCPTLIPNHEAT